MKISRTQIQARVWKPRSSSYNINVLTLCGLRDDKGRIYSTIVSVIVIQAGGACQMLTEWPSVLHSKPDCSGYKLLCTQGVPGDLCTTDL